MTDSVPGPRFPRWLALPCLAAALFLAGCGPKPVHFPTESLTDAARAVGAAAAFDTDDDGEADFFLYADDAGRQNRIGYDLDADAGPDQIVPLDAVRWPHCRHVVILLDGVAHDVARAHYEAGGLRMFHPPSKLVAPYPTMTDLAMEDLFGYMPALAYEAKFYNRRTDETAGGSGAYLAARNEPYDRIIDWRSDLIMVPFFYLFPRAVFGKELNDCKEAFDKGETHEMITYFGSTAGMGTRMGRAGQIESLEGIERMIRQMLHETRGLVKFTLASDHGHGYEPVRLLDFEELLKPMGWRLTDRLRDPKDVVTVRFGLTTYASFSTRKRAELAADLVTINGVELASHADGETVVVLAPGGGRAVIRRKDGRYAYEAVSGDPLGLKTILAKLGPGVDGYHDPNDLLPATVDHHWPAPLQRLWRAHFSLVENPPDVIASLADDVCTGSESFARFITAESTHGSLNRLNSVAFIMSTAGPLPPVLRSSDVPAAMRELLDTPDWPVGR